MATLEEMFRDLSTARHEVLPSKYWIELNKINVAQLESTGYQSFKRTLALNYFTWVVKRKNSQFQFLVKKLSKTTFLRNLLRTLFCLPHQQLSFKRSIRFNLFTYLLWDYVLQNDPARVLDQLEEPLEGGPFRIYRSGRLISQDLANSALEYNSVMSGVKESAEIRSIMELGSGYGRTAYVFLKLLPGVKYILVDIPPALYVCEKYLTSQFPDRRIFRYRPFKKYLEIQEEYESADIAFLLSSQLDLIPDKSVDLFVNISSLHEMRHDQIHYYFSVVHRLTKEYFYLKQWKSTQMPFEDILITEADYPIRSTWQRIFWRECKVQTHFFEALLSIR